jgi:quercetin dioxygenase-like cupin family protein
MDNQVVPSVPESVQSNVESSLETRISSDYDTPSITKFYQIELTTLEGRRKAEQVFDEQKIDLSVPPDGSREQFALAGSLFTFLKTGEETNGQYALFDVVVPPGVGPEAHYHENQFDMVKVLEGEVTFQEGTQIKVLGPGETNVFTKQHLHTFRNTGDKPARMLMLLPPAGFEDIIRESSELVTDPSLSLPEPDFDKIAATDARHGIFFYPEATLTRKPAMQDGGVTLIGEQFADILTGGVGSDILIGRDGNDQLIGRSGADILIGGSGVDVLSGGSGKDILSGREGKDILTGGSGSDTFYLPIKGQGQGPDLITDFNSNEDLIKLSGGLKFPDLLITQGIGNQANNTLIGIVGSNDLLATLAGIQASTISVVQFTELSG